MHFEVRLCLLDNFRTVRWFLTQRAYRKFCDEVAEFGEFLILRLHLFWKAVSLNKWRILELQISKHPLFPWFSGVNHRVIQLFLFGLGQKVLQILNTCAFLQSLENYFIIDKPIPILISDMKVLIWVFRFSNFAFAIEFLSALVIPL